MYKIPSLLLAGILINSRYLLLSFHLFDLLLPKITPFFHSFFLLFLSVNLLELDWIIVTHSWFFVKTYALCSLIRTPYSNFINNSSLHEWILSFFYVHYLILKNWLLRINTFKYLWFNLCFFLINLLACLKENEKTCCVVSFKNSCIYSSQILFNFISITF
jgi:hypothetical protein